MKGFVRGYLEMQRNRQLWWQWIDLFVGAAATWVLWDSAGHTIAIVFAAAWAVLMLLGLGVLVAHSLRERRGR